MTEWSQKDDQGAPSGRMKMAIVIMLLIILLPTMFASVPLSKIVVTFTNTDQSYGATVYGHISGVMNDYFSFSLAPGDDYTLTYHVRPGSWHIGGSYMLMSEEYYSYSSSVLPFQVDRVDINLAN